MLNEILTFFGFNYFRGVFIFRILSILSHFFIIADCRVGWIFGAFGWSVCRVRRPGRLVAEGELGGEFLFGYLAADRPKVRFYFGFLLRGYWLVHVKNAPSRG